MKLDRRGFLKASAGTAGVVLLGSQGLGTVARAASSGQDLAMLVDVSKCVGCWWCYAACKKYNNLPETIEPDLEKLPELSTECWTTLFGLKRGDDWSLRKQACMHCTDAACVEVCPTGALSYNELGFVQYDREKCSGCGYCAQNCPFEIPQLESSRVTGAGVPHFDVAPAATGRARSVGIVVRVPAGRVVAPFGDDDRSEGRTVDRQTAIDP